MKDLKSHLEDSGFRNVITYIQSGNLAFESESSDTKETELSIKNVIHTHFGLDIELVVLSSIELENILKKNPFTEPNYDEKRTYFTFFASPPSVEKIFGIHSLSYPDEEIFCTDRVAYLYSNLGYGKVKLSTNFLEKKLEVPVTTRNFNTVRKMLSVFEN